MDIKSVILDGSSIIRYLPDGTVIIEDYTSNKMYIFYPPITVK